MRVKLIKKDTGFTGRIWMLESNNADDIGGYWFCHDFGGYFDVPKSVSEIELVISDRKMRESIEISKCITYGVKLELPEYGRHVRVYQSLYDIIEEYLQTREKCYIRIEYGS